MNRPANTIDRKGATAIKLALSINLLMSMALAFSMLPAIAQAEFDQNSYLPPEVVPIQQSAANAVSQSQSRSYSQPAQSTTNVPGLVTNSNNAGGVPQSAQDMRNQIFGQLMGKGNYPQLNNQNSVWTNQSGQMGQSAQPAGQSSQGSQQYNQAPGQSVQPLGQSNQPFVQANQSIGQSNWIMPEQNNAMANANPAQTQTLSGSVQNASAMSPNQNGYGYSHAVSSVSGLGMTAYALGMSRGSGSLYGAGLMGATSLFSAVLRGGLHF